MRKKNICILHLEDDPLDIDLIKSTLNKESNKYSIINVKDKKNFEKELNNNKIDIILADYSLPSFNGIEAFKIVIKTKPSIPFIFVSGAIGEDLAIECLKLGATDYILKNQLTRLETSIQRALNEIDEKEKRINAETQLKKSYSKLQKTFEQIVDAFSSLSEKKDPYTAGHQRNVSLIACAIAKEMDLTPDQIQGLRIASLLHDIGKIYVPSEILNKPGKLNKFEFNIIKTHPQVGYDILKGIQFPWPVALIILQHHEKIDGSGYNQGLAGDQILIESRILRVADVIEAMVSHRPYRPSLSLDEALAEILNNKGIFYDPIVVKNCIDIFEEKDFSIENFSKI
jgi:putative nucleotidyltransferase with HDIG domain